MKPKKEIPQYKTGTCLTCGKDDAKLSAGRCILAPYCYEKHRKEVRDARKQERGIEPKKVKRMPIGTISQNKKEALAKYRRIRDKYFIENPVCEFPGCEIRNITLHHKRGRVGSFLTDKRYFCSLCMKHHRYVEENPIEAKKLGLSESRL